MKDILRPPCRQARKTGDRINFFSLRNCCNYLESLLPAEGQSKLILPLRNCCKYLKSLLPAEGQSKLILPLRNCCKLLKSLVIFSPPPPPPHCVITKSPVWPIIPAKPGIPSLYENNPSFPVLSLDRTLSTLYSYFTCFIAIPHPHRGGGWHRIISRKKPLQRNVWAILGRDVLSKLIFLFICLLSFIACEKRQEKKSSVQKKSPTCLEKLEDFKTCLLSQFYSVSCPDMTVEKRKVLIELCQKKHLHSALEKECPQPIQDLQKSISEKKV